MLDRELPKLDPERFKQWLEKENKQRSSRREDARKMNETRVEDTIAGKLGIMSHHPKV